MKTTMLMVLAAGLAAAAWGYEWPASGSASLTTADCDGNGEVVVTDSDYAAANALTDITVGAGVKLVFNTTLPPTVALKGTGGTFVKRGDAEWTQSTSQPNFNGDWVLEGGVTIANVATASFGANNSKYALYVRSGASFTVATAVLDAWQLADRKIHLAGTGYQDKGAYYSLGNTAKTTAWKNIILDDDTTIRLTGGYLFVYGSTYEFNNHVCTVLGNKTLYFLSGAFKNGRLVIGDGTDSPTLCLRTSHKTTDTNFEIVFNDGTKLDLYNEPYAFPGKVTVNGTVTLSHSHQAADVCTESDATVCLSGQINLARADSILKCTIMSQPNYHDPFVVYITGYIYGPGGIRMSSTGVCEKSLVLSCPTNAFTGGVKVMAGNLRLLDHGAIPDYTKVTVVDGATVTAVMPAEGAAWTAEKTADLKKMNCEDSAVSIVDMTALGTSSLVYAAADLEAGTADGDPVALRVGVRPVDGTIAVTGNFTKAFQPVAWGDNTLAVAGHVPHLESLAITSGATTCSGTLVVTNAGTTTLAYPYYVGLKGGARDLVLANTTVTMEGLRQRYSGTKSNADYCSDYTSNAVLVGSSDTVKSVAYPGRLTIGENCTITARCTCAWGYGTSARQTQGAIVQTAGETCFVGSVDDSVCSLWGYNAPCSVTLAGGTMTWWGYHQFGFGGATYGGATFHQTGGEFVSRGIDKKGSCFVDMARSGAVRTSWLQTGGTARFYGNILLARAEGSQASITVMGSNTRFIADMGVSWGYAKKENPILTIRDGAQYEGYLTASRFKTNYHASNNWWAVFNCYADGGWIKHSGSQPLGSRGDRNDPLSDAPYGPTRIASAGAGFGFDTPSAGNIAEVSNPITSVTGNGVAGVAGGWARLETELLVSPFVEILGDGTNATAFALMDGGAITNILITNPGENYTVATAKVMTAMSTAGTPTYSYYECALAPNVPGGLNKRGPGTLKLAVTNDYTGATRVLEGTLRLSAPDVISTASALSVEGGIFDFGSHTNNFRAVGGPSGKITGCGAPVLVVETLLAGTTTNLVFNGLSVRVTGAFAITGAELQAGKGPAYATAVAFDDAAGVRLTGLDALDPEKRGGYDVLSATGGLTGAKVLNADELPPGWRVGVRGSVLRCTHSNGTTILLR